MKLSSGCNLKEGITLALDLSLQIQNANTPFQFIIVTFRDHSPTGILPRGVVDLLQKTSSISSPQYQ